MKLDFRLAEPTTDSWSHADEEDFRYRVALGDLILEIGSKNFSTHWGWVPLIDLAASLRHIAKKLQHSGRTETFEFSESQSWRPSSRQGGQVIITASYTPGEGTDKYARAVAAAKQ